MALQKTVKQRILQIFNGQDLVLRPDTIQHAPLFQNGLKRDLAPPFSLEGTKFTIFLPHIQILLHAILNKNWSSN